MNWTKEDIAFLLKAFDECASAELRMECEGMKLELKKNCRPEEKKSSQIQRGPEQISAAPKGTDSGYVIRAALAGIFYRSSAPNAEPYVKEGSRVKKGDVIGLMEAMKVMSEITSPVDGIVRSIKAENGVFAEFNSELMVIEEA